MTPFQRKCYQWVSTNRGVLTEIANAVRPKVRSQYVGMVLRGERKSRDGRIEAMLKKRNAPVKRSADE